MIDDDESALHVEESDVIYEQEVYDMDHDFVEDDCDVTIEDSEVVMSSPMTYAQIVKRSREGEKIEKYFNTFCIFIAVN